MKNLLLPILFVMGLSTVANAGLLLEPYLALVLSGKSSSSSDTKFSGNVMGARIGWGMLGFAVGLDALLAGTITSKTDSTTQDVKPSGFGLFASYSFPIMVRGYISYFPTYTGKNDGIELTGSSNKLGIQYTGLPFVAIGLESESISIKKSKSSGVTTDFNNTLTYTNLVISAPFNL